MSIVFGLTDNSDGYLIADTLLTKEGLEAPERDPSTSFNPLNHF